ncbi:MAG: hypothetical protein Kow00124_09160 [Anaerolineae bacterium]
MTCKDKAQRAYPGVPGAVAMHLGRKKLLILTASIALLGAALFVFRKPLALAIGDYLVIQDDLQPADVIHVIAGDDYRTDYAIQLYQQGYGQQIFFTGGWCTTHNYYHGQHGEELATAQGVPEEAVAIDESEVISTYAEALRLRELIAQSPTPIRSVIVVSDPFHMRRARWAYRHVLGDEVRVQMAPVPFEQAPYRREWWTDDESRRYVRDEYLKMAYYLARYQLSWGKLQEWLASLDVG